MTRLFLLVLTFAFCGATASAPLNIALSDLSPRGVTADEAGIISDRLREELLATRSFRVMERDMMESILREQSFQKSGTCNDAECQVEIGRMLGVDRMLVGSIGKLGKVYSVSVRMLDVETGEIVASISQDYEGAIEGLLKGTLRTLALKIAANANPPPAVKASQPQQTLDVMAEQANAGAPPPPPMGLASRGYPEIGLAWSVPKPDGPKSSFSLSNSSIGGLSLKPASNTPINWVNHANNFSYDQITAPQYQALDQNGRKAVLYGRLLYFGSNYAARETSLDTSAIRLAMEKDLQSELAVASFARHRAARRTKAVLWGGIGMTIGALAGYVGTLGPTTCSTDSYGTTSCSTSSNETLANTGGLLFLGSAAYTLLRLAINSSEEDQDLAMIRSGVSNLSKPSPIP